MSSASIIDHLFIGDINSIQNQYFLKNNNINFIIDLSDSEVINSIGIKTLKIDDLPDLDYSVYSKLTPDQYYDMNDYTDQLLTTSRYLSSIINEKISLGYNVLVACFSGINVSSFVISIYLMEYMNYSYERVFNLLNHINRTKRNKPALTNRMFCSILIKTTR